MPSVHLSYYSLTQYLFILSTYSRLGAMHSAKKTKKDTVFVHKSLLILHEGRRTLHYKPVALHCIAFWVLCGWKDVYGELAIPIEKKGVKGFSILAPANIFNHLKLKLRLELEGRTVKKLLYKQKPHQELDSISREEGLQYWMAMLKTITQPSSQCSKEVKGHTQNEM